tara:strand:- start:2866 stop:3741 length:876 start_codon:yes stop_codon:yes gene_type:complete
MSGNKHINKLAIQIANKEKATLFIDEHIEKAEKTLQAFIGARAVGEKQIAELKKQQEDIKNHKPGQLAKVSIYEFVNDWVRPEISFKIFSYLPDPHKEGVNKAQTHRRYYSKERVGNVGRFKGSWKERKFYRTSRNTYGNRETPYCELYLYKHISDPYFLKNSTERRFYEKMSHWVMNQQNMGARNQLFSLARLRNTNPLLLELWSFHQVKLNNNLHKKFIITKGEIKKYLQMNKVKGRTDLTYGVKCSEINGTDEYLGNSDGTPNWNADTDIWFPPQARRELVGALMKVE